MFKKLLIYNIKNIDYSLLLLDLIAGLSLGHLYFLPLWELALDASPRLFLVDESLRLSLIAPLITLTLIFAIIGTLSIRICRNSFPNSGGLLWITMVFMASFSLLRTIIYEFFAKFPLIANSRNAKMLLMLFLISSLFGSMVWMGIRSWIISSRRILLIISPLIIIIWVQVIINFYTMPSRIISQHPKSLSNSNRHTWVLLFDEFDGKIILNGQPPLAGMQELAKWKAFSLFATHAYPPAGATLWSVPALLRGQQLAKNPLDLVKINSWEDLVDAGKSIKWDWTDNLLTDVTSRGETTSLIGWGFPYPHIYRNSVNSLSFLEENLQSKFVNSKPSFAFLFKLAALEVSIGPFMMLGESPSIIHARVLDEIHIHLKRLINAPPNFVWIHYPVPHYPSVKNGGSYADNLVAVDNELKYFREQLQVNNLWDQSTILVMSDHWLRQAPRGSLLYSVKFFTGYERRWENVDHRVPFLIKLPNQTTGVIHDQGFNTIILRNLLAALHGGEIDTPQKVSDWLSRNTPFVESPTTTADP